MQGENRRKVCRLRNGSGSPDLRRFVKRGVEGVEILGIQLVGDNAEALAEALEVHDLPLPQELDGIPHVRVVGKAQDVVIGHAGLLLRAQILVQVGNGVPGHREGCGAEGRAGSRYRIHASGVIHKIGVKARLLYLLRSQIPGKLVDNSAYHFQVGQFFGAYIVLRNVPNQALYGQARCFRPICT